MIKNESNTTDRNIDWEDVENKISIICRKFSNIDARFRDDLAQELRIHAYYYSDDYYDLQRKAIDYWRTLTRKVFPEIPYIDLELTAGTNKFNDSGITYQETLKAVRTELSRNEYETSGEIKINELALKILDIINEDIDGSTITEESCRCDDSINLHKYRNGKINVSYLDLRFPDINYKTVSKALNRLREVIEGLIDMGKI